MGHRTPTGVEPKDYDDDESMIYCLVESTFVIIAEPAICLPTHLN